MRTPFSSGSSKAHRVTCTSLYRHLLRQCRQFDDPAVAHTLRKCITFRFHLDKAVRPPNVIAEALSQARNALTLLRSASQGHPDARKQLLSVITNTVRKAEDTAALRQHQNALRSAADPKKSKKVAHLRDDNTKHWAAAIPNPIPITDRPVPKDQLPNPERRRNVPTLAHVHGHSFLRYKTGPQSPILSRMLSDALTTERRRWAQKGEIEEAVSHAQLQDNWDRLTETHQESWVTDTARVAAKMTDILRDSVAKKDQRAIDMWNKVRMERAMAQREKAELKMYRLQRLIEAVDRNDQAILKTLKASRDELVQRYKDLCAEAAMPLSVLSEKPYKPHIA